MTCQTGTTVNTPIEPSGANTNTVFQNSAILNMNINSAAIRFTSGDDGATITMADAARVQTYASGEQAVQSLSANNITITLNGTSRLFADNTTATEFNRSGGAIENNHIYLNDSSLIYSFANRGIDINNTSGLVSNNTIVLNSGQVVGRTEAIFLRGSAGVSNNDIIFDGGRSVKNALGSIANTRGVFINGNSGAASMNRVLMYNGGLLDHNLENVYVRSNDTVTLNTVLLDGSSTSITQENVEIFSASGDVSGNQVTIGGTAIAGRSNVRIQTDAGSVISNTVTINTGTNLTAGPTSYGVLLFGNNASTVDSNKIYFNGSMTSAYQPIRLRAGAGTISNNTINLTDGYVKSTSYQGILASATGTISGNSITLNGNTRIEGGPRAGITFQSATNLTGNTVTLNGTSTVISNGSHGVFFDGPAGTNNQVFVNDTAVINTGSNTAHGVYFKSTGNNVVNVASGSYILALGANSAGVKDLAGNTTVIVGGRIDASFRSVDLGSGNDELRLRSGGVIGNTADGGGDTDTVRLIESGSTGAALINFETLVMDGTDWALNSSFNLGGAGTTSVNSGVLSINATLTSPTVDVNAGGTLGGTGSVVGSVNALTGGKIAPGNSIGTFSTGDLKLQSGSTLEIEVSDTAADKLDVTGTVNISDATLNVIPDASGFTGMGLTSFTIVENDGADVVSGSGFGTITDEFALFDASVVTNGGDGNDVVLTLAQVAMATQVAETENQRQIGDVIDQLLNDPNLSPEAQNLINEISALSSEELLGALDSLSGDGLGNLADISISDVESVLDILSNRFGILLGNRVARGTQNTKVASAAFSQISSGLSQITNDGVFATTMTDAPILASVSGLSKTFSHDSGFSAWIEGFGTFGDLESGNANTADTDYRLFGTTAGVDYAFDSGILAGLSIGYSKSKADVDARLTEVEGDTFRLSAFGGANIGDGYVAGALSYAFTDFDGQRVITLLSSTALSNFDADEITGYVEGGYAFNAIGELIVEPAISVRYTNFQADGYTETGAGAANLTVSDRETNSISGSVGARLRQEVELDTGLRLTPEFRTFLNHEFDETERVINAALAGGSFTVQGTKAPRTTATVGGGISVMLADRAKLFVNYDAELAERLTEQTVAGTLQWQF